MTTRFKPTPDLIEKLDIEFEEIPEDEGPDFAEWCAKHGFDVLGSSRRAWCGQLSTYLRGSKYLVFMDGVLAGLTD